jgi:hypothetical protein
VWHTISGKEEISKLSAGNLVSWAYLVVDVAFALVFFAHRGKVLQQELGRFRLFGARCGTA